MLRIITLLISLLIGAAAMALEEPAFEKLLEKDGIEFRRYAPYNVAEVTVTGDQADRRAFSILAGYIFGGNEKSEKMQMTAPVETRGRKYAFVMESKYSLDTLPRPDDGTIELRKRPSRIVAVHQFSGRWSEENIRKHEMRLLERLAKQGIEVVGDPELARYNSPFTPWFLRRNEIIVPVNWLSVDAGELIATEVPAGL